MANSKKKRTRDAIIDVALDEFVGNGINDTSFERIAEKAGIARRTLYYHFSGKEELLHAVIDIRLKTAIDDIQFFRQSEADIRSVALFCLNFWVQDPRLPRLFRRIQEEHILIFSQLHDQLLGEFSLLLEEQNKKSVLRFSDMRINLKLIFFSLFPLLDAISSVPNYKEQFIEIFISTLAAD